MLRTQTAVMSQLLCDLPNAPATTRQPVGGLLLRALGLVERDPDFAASVAAGFIETDVDAWAASLPGGAL